MAFEQYWLEIFDWIFGMENFDIVIGNPPYGATYPTEYKKYFKEHYKSAKTIANEQKDSLDTFSLFIENGFNVLKTGGHLNLSHRCFNRTHSNPALELPT
ncbi:MAG: Eco57I restriction-modification methylase domain-containing protein [Planctomycetaceae bacterium]|jgi:tRNA1(Val) A37 N6-methylase TrmN6|nr:Eco57I restriction-modification methylase domain-containing protein [Planctomycetaceae bacterium]